MDTHVLSHAHVRTHTYKLTHTHTHTRGNGQAAWNDMDIQPGHKHVNAECTLTWTYSMDTGLQHGHGLAAWT
jgi:hypothetical protein